LIADFPIANADLKKQLAIGNWQLAMILLEV